MTYQTEPYGPTPTPPPPMHPAPAPRRGKAVAIAAAVAVVLALMIGAILYAAGSFSGGGLSKESAQRACRTAFGDEWKQRSTQTSGGSTDIIASVNNIEMLETAKSGDGYTVNGVVHYTLTTALVAPVEGSIDLTCTATGSDDAPTTTVDNR